MLLLLVILITFHWTNSELSGKLECADSIEWIKVSLNSLGQKVVLAVGRVVWPSPLVLCLANDFEVDYWCIWNFDGMMIGSKNTEDPKERNLLLCHFVSTITSIWIVLGQDIPSSQWEASNWLWEPWCSCFTKMVPCSVDSRWILENWP